MSIEARFQFQRGAFELDLALSLPSKGVSAIFGPSGSGKTTLLRLLAGLEYCPNAALDIGEDCWQKARLFVPSHQRSLAYVFQEASLFEHLTVRGNIEYGYKRLAQTERTILLEHIIELLGLSHLLSRSTQQLSGGERQRVAIARALAVSPKLLLMDEPLSALDIQHKQELLPYLESLRDDLQIPIIYVSHVPAEVARISDYLVLLEHGRVLAQGVTAELMARLDLPFAHEPDAVTIVEGRVAEHDKTYHLTEFETPLGRIAAPGITAVLGARLRLQIAARDISLTLSVQSDTSVLNIFPAIVDQLIEDRPGQMIVRLIAAETPILARLTRKSVVSMELRPGKKVFAQAKSIAVLH